MSDARERIRQKILADIKKRVDTYWSESQKNDAGFSDTAKAAKEEIHKWAAIDLNFLHKEYEKLHAENARLRAELEAAKRDITSLGNGEYSICDMCGLYGDANDSTKCPSQLQTMQRNVRHAVYAVGTKRPGGITNEADWGMWVSWSTPNMLMESAKEKCLVCDLSTDQQRQCPLAKALETLPAEKDENAPGCGWYGRL